MLVGVVIYKGEGLAEDEVIRTGRKGVFFLHFLRFLKPKEALTQATNWQIYTMKLDNYKLDPHASK